MIETRALLTRDTKERYKREKKYQREKKYKTERTIQQPGKQRPLRKLEDTVT